MKGYAQNGHASKWAIYEHFADNWEARARLETRDSKAGKPAEHQQTWAGGEGLPVSQARLAYVYRIVNYNRMVPFEWTEKASGLMASCSFGGVVIMVAAGTTRATNAPHGSPKRGARPTKQSIRRRGALEETGMIGRDADHSRRLRRPSRDRTSARTFDQRAGANGAG